MRKWSSDNFGACAKGVPGRGSKTLSGIDGTSSSRSANARSMRSSAVSPMPKSPPEQTSSPAALAARMVFTLSSQVCDEHTCGKNRSEVSKLQCTRTRPASLRSARSFSLRSPSEAQSSSLGLVLRSFLRCSAYIRVSRAEGLRPLATSEKRVMPPAAARSAAASTSLTGKMG